MHKTKKCITCEEIKREDLFWKTGYGGNRRKSCSLCTTKHQQKYVAMREKKYTITEKWPFDHGWWIDEYEKGFSQQRPLKPIVLHPIKIHRKG